MKLQILLVVSGMAVSLLCGCARTEAADPSSSAEERSSTVQTTGSAVESTGESLLEGVEITLPDSITRQPVSDTREHFCLDGEVVGGIELLDIAGQMDTMSMGDYAQQALTVTKAVYDTEYDYMAEGDSFCKAVVSMSSREGREFYHYFFQGEEMGYDVWIDNSVLDTLEMKSCLKTLRAGDLELPQEDMTKNETPLLTLRMTLPDGIIKQPKRTTRTLLYSGQTLAANPRSCVAISFSEGSKARHSASSRQARGSSIEVGSSNKIASGFMARTPASAARRFSPPERQVTSRSAR